MASAMSCQQSMQETDRVVLLGRLDICTNVEQLQQWRRGAAEPVDERRHATTAQTARTNILRATWKTAVPDMQTIARGQE